MNFHRLIALALSLFVIVCPSFAQNLDVIRERVGETDSPFAFRKKVVRIHFEQLEEPDPEAPFPFRVVEEQEWEVVSLKSYAQYVGTLYYSEDQQVVSVEEKAEDENTWSRAITEDAAYKQSGIFHGDYRLTTFGKIFYKAGEAHSYRTVMHYPDVRYYSQVYLLEPFPVLDFRLEVTVPDWLEVEMKEFNFGDAEVARRTGTVDGGTRHVFERTDVPARVREDAMPGPSYVYPHVLLIPQAYSLDGRGGDIFRGTGDLYRWYRSLTQGVEENPQALEALVAELTAGAKSDREKVERIFYWVQSNIRYIAFEDGIAGFRPEAGHVVCEKRFGDCKGMANLTKQMLQIAGFDPRLTWIGTNRLAYDYSTPSLVVDNHMICSVVVEGERLFLDPTEKYLRFGEYAERIQGRQVLIEDGDNFIIDRVPLMTPEANRSAWSLDLRVEGETLMGTGRYDWSGESKQDILYVADQLSGEDLRKGVAHFLSDGNKDIVPSELKLSGFEESDPTSSAEFSFRAANRASQFGEEIYLNLDHFQYFRMHQIEEDRQMPIQLGNKIQYVGNIRLELPEGFELSHLPDPVRFESEALKIEASYAVEDGKLLYRSRITAPRSLLMPKDFESWNEGIALLKAFYDDQIILTQKNP